METFFVFLLVGIVIVLLGFLSIRKGSQKKHSENKCAAPVRKNKSRGKLAVLGILLVAVIGVGGCFGFRKGGKIYDAQSMQSLSDYAKQLEKAGNSEAAEAVYEIMAQGGGAELIEKAHEDIPVIKQVDELEHLRKIFGNRKGGGSDE